MLDTFQWEADASDREVAKLADVYGRIARSVFKYRP
jgi:hypothetical protein